MEFIPNVEARISGPVTQPRQHTWRLRDANKMTARQVAQGKNVLAPFPGKTENLTRMIQSSILAVLVKIKIKKGKEKERPDRNGVRERLPPIPHP